MTGGGGGWRWWWPAMVVAGGDDGRSWWWAEVTVTVAGGGGGRWLVRKEGRGILGIKDLFHLVPPILMPNMGLVVLIHVCSTLFCYQTQPWWTTNFNSKSNVKVGGLII